MNVPFVDLKRQYKNIKEEVDNAIQDVLGNASFVLGEKVNKFEKDFAEFCGVKYALGVGTGTSALHLALLASGIKAGDEVITVPNTFIATAEAISQAGATPVFVDIDKQTYNLDASLLKAAITDKTRAIIPVHLYGQAADIDPILEIAEEYNLKIIEDACQAHGTEYKGKKVGGFGDVGCFSFYPGKNLGAYGEGGMITTNNEEIYNTIKILRDHGQKEKYIHKIKGYNSRLEEIQGAVLDIKLKYLPDWNNGRRKNAKLYNDLLSGVGVETPFEADYGRHIYHLYVIRDNKRDDLRKWLGSRGVATGLHYPIPIHLQEAYSELNIKKESFPVSEEYAKKILSLPMFPELTEEEIIYVVDSIKKFKL